MPDQPLWVVLVPDLASAPPASIQGPLAAACHVAASAVWHPALIAHAQKLPRYESLDRPPAPGPGQVQVIPAGCEPLLASGHRTQAADSGAAWLTAGPDRRVTLDSWPQLLPDLEPLASSDPTVSDFFALGTATWLLENLARAMGYPDALDRDLLAQETVAAARAWLGGDPATSAGRLRAAFELLTQAREKFYPVEDHFLDVVLLDPATPAADLLDLLALNVPFTLLASGRAIEALAASDPEILQRLRAAVSDDSADVVGGTYDEPDESHLPIESVLWHYRRGADAYARHFDGRGVETWARRRFGLHPMIPQLARRHGIRFAWHAAFDSGRFPVPADTKRLWESPDGATLETLFRPPLAADDPASVLRLPSTLARSLKTDHVATLPLLHWPRPVADWYLDLRRSASFSPVLGRWTTLGRFFELTDRPWDLFRPTPDDYHPPYTADALRTGQPDPISRPARHARLRARLDALTTLHACAAILDARLQPPSPPPPTDPPPFDHTPPPLDTAESALEVGATPSAETLLDQAQAQLLERLALQLAPPPPDTPADSAGYFIFNPIGCSRRAVVVLPDAPLDQIPVGPLRAAQFTDQGVAGVVDLPPFGFVWIPSLRPSPSLTPPDPPPLRASGQTLANQWIEATFDERTGGLRSIRRPGEPTPRLAQQLVATGLPEPSTMTASSIEVDFAGPALAQIVSRGTLGLPSDPATPLARFRQTVRLWAGRPILELTIELEDISPALRNSDPTTDPPVLACRWAWADAAATVRRSWFGQLETTRSPDADTPEALLIDSRNQLSAILFGGLARHRRHGPRMLDTWLIAGAEASTTLNLAVVLDHDQPARALTDWLTPALVQPLAHNPPAGRDAGWLFRIDHRGILITRIAFAPATADGRGWGLTLHLLETLGQPARCQLRLFLDPIGARLVDFLGDLIMDLRVEGDSISIDLTPHELACVEITLGLYP
ncbi:MAG: hypothetical protein KatS3mg108_3018 [Isosphaeraceae bacterium]|jgi:alpha-mannosidase|nr:MAG: hypothetical protein KatS3mg108_3018 [Isosphaeraceae bacterium]